MYGNSPIVYLLLAVMAPMFVLWGAKFLQATFVGKCLRELGKHSLTIFCIEMAFIVWAKEFYQLMFPNFGINYLTGVFEIVTALVGGWLVSLLLHRIKPLSRLLY